MLPARVYKAVSLGWLEATCTLNQQISTAADDFLIIIIIIIIIIIQSKHGLTFHVGRLLSDRGFKWIVRTYFSLKNKKKMSVSSAAVLPDAERVNSLISIWIIFYPGTNSADDTLVIIFLTSPENRIWHFMQSVSIGDTLHEMSNSVFCEK